jgi:hypothetical protein
MSKLLRQLRISGEASTEDFEAANRRQQIYGGSFDTVLLELQILTPLQLDEQLAQCSGLPTVPATLLTPGSERPWDAIAPALVDLGWAMPLSRSGGRVQVGVHPEIPDEQMDLIRDQPGLELMVTAECCLARLGSERTGSLTPQRYAILAAAYVQGIGGGDLRAPRESPGAPWKQNSVARKSDQTLPGEGHPTTPAPQTPQTPSGPFLPPPSHDDGSPPSWLPQAGATDGTPVATLARVTPVPRQAGAIERTPPPPSFSLPTGGKPFGGRSLSYAATTSSEAGPSNSGSTTPPPPRFAPPSAKPPRPAEQLDAPPVRTKKSRSKPRVENYDATDLRRRFEAAQDRDGVTDTLLAGATCLVSRVVLLAIRKSGLKWLAASESVDEPANPLIPLSNALHTALHGEGQFLRCEDEALRLAVGQQSAVPCALLPVEVAGRRVLALYVDADGVALDDDDVESLRELTRWAGLALTRVVRGNAESRKQQQGMAHPDLAPAAVTDTEDSDSISLRPQPGLDRSDAGIPSLVVPKREANAPVVPPLARTLVPSFRVPSPAKSTSGSISARVPRLIDTAPPRSTTLISTSAPAESSSPPLASTPLAAPPVRDLGAPVAPGTQAAVAAAAAAPPRAIPPVRTPVPSVRSARPAPNPQRDGTLSPQRHETPPPSATQPKPKPESRSFDDTMIPTRPVAPPVQSAAPPVRSGAPPVRTPPVRPALSRTPAPSRNPTLPGTRSEMAALGAPLMQPSGGRGGLVLDDEDRHDDSAERSSEQIPRETLDRTIDAAMRDPTAIPALLELGEVALSRLASRYPEPLDVNRRDLNNLPPLSAHGPLVRLAVQLGQRVSPMIRELLDHPEAKVRFYAAFTFQELRDEMVLDGLATRAFDSDGDVRAISMRVLETYSRSTHYSARISAIREQLSSNNQTRQIHAARAVGTLRDVNAVPALIELLEATEKRVRDIGLEGLCSITGQQLGSRSARWRAWWEANKELHRVEWIIGALSHKDSGVRGWASVELRRITGQPYALPVEGSKRERDQVIRQWVEWWARQGRASFGA